MKHLRLSKKLSITDLASSARISKGHLSNIENHGSSPSVQVIKKLALALEIPVELIIGHSPSQLDPEWTDLMIQAKNMGISKEEIQTFLAYESWKLFLKKEG
ncbi:helix-turn-helix domain-containing protein [Fictibacillus barbaricus]|uniref:helix-turn-helix domain-containing protein n=1 Tax=Fictibacillus barbaricus TaxID=182136 RepID=UPI0035A23A85